MTIISLISVLRYLLQLCCSFCRESSKHSFYLETVVDGLKERLASVEFTEKELLEVRVNCGIVEAKLEEYKKAAEEVLGSGSSPSQLVKYIRSVQQESLEVANRHSQLQCRLVY